jgi:hypothetical protein
MHKIIISLIFILGGLAYGSLAFDKIYDRTLGWLVNQQLMKPPLIKNLEKTFPFGRRPTILMYSLGLIILGIYILWRL